MRKHLPLALLLALLAVNDGAAQIPKKGANGGEIIVMEGHPIEFVTKDLEIAFYIFGEDGNPTPTKGAAARAVIQDAGKTTTVNLAPAEPNKFVGQLQSPVGSKARVVFAAKV